MRLRSVFTIAVLFGEKTRNHTWSVKSFRPQKYVVRAPITGPNAPIDTNASARNGSRPSAYSFCGVERSPLPARELAIAPLFHATAA